MTKEERLDKVTRDFSLLSEEKQDHILSVLQALAFAHDTASDNPNVGKFIETRSVKDEK
ncbi:MAG: hypothetical protein FWG29_04630 [Treponema sp.]|nr:hypothetical protein [Treponema sp.]